MSTPPQDDGRQSSPLRSLPAEFVDFLVHNKRWWLTPIVVVLVLLVAIILLTSPGNRPFIYPQQ
jgi:hypothetical protein